MNTIYITNPVASLRASGEQTARLDANRHALNSVTILKSSEAQAVRTFPDVVLKVSFSTYMLYGVSTTSDVYTI